MVRDRLRRVGVEGARPRARRLYETGVPADEAGGRLVHVDHVGVEIGELAAQRRSPPTGTASCWRSSRSSRTPCCVRACAGSRAAPRCSGGPLWSRRVNRSGGSQGASTRTSSPPEISSAARASTWRLTPPGYVHEYGVTRAIRTTGMVKGLVGVPGSVNTPRTGGAGTQVDRAQARAGPSRSRSRRSRAGSRRARRGTRSGPATRRRTSQDRLAADEAGDEQQDHGDEQLRVDRVGEACSPSG